MMSDVFGSTDSRYSINYPHTLYCGHSACEKCIRRSLYTNKYVVCSICKEVSRIGVVGNDKLTNTSDYFVPSFHLIGKLFVRLQNEINIENALIGFIPAVVSFTDTASNVLPYFQSASTKLCFECRNSEANGFCSTCDALFCTVCFRKVHEANVLRRHRLDPIPNEEATQCKYHNLPNENHCDTCSIDVCSECVTALHIKHSVISFKDRDTKCVNELRDLNSKIDAEIINLEKLFQTLLVEHKLKRLIGTENINRIKLEISRYYVHTISTLERKEIENFKQADAFLTNTTQFIYDYRNKITHQIQCLKYTSDYIKNMIDNVGQINLINAVTEVREYFNRQNIAKRPIYLKDENFRFTASKLTTHTPINCHFIQEGEAVPKEYEELTDDCSVMSGSNEFVGRSDQSNSIKTSSYKNKLKVIGYRGSSKFVKGKSEFVIITHLISPAEFFVRPKSLNEKLNFVETCIEQTVNPLPQNNIKSGILCLAPFSNQLYRARIIDTSIPSFPDSVRVFFIDYGNEDYVPKNELMVLPNTLENIHDLAFRCSLFDWHPSLIQETDDEVNKRFIELLETKDEYIMTVIHAERLTCLEVELNMIIDGFTISILKSLYSVLHRCHINVTVSPYNQHNQQRRFFSQKQFYYSNSEFKYGETYDVKISHINSPTDFYVQGNTSGSVINGILSELKVFFQPVWKNEYFVFDPVIGMPVAAKPLASNVWYRGEIRHMGAEKLETRKFTILFVDIGIIEILPFKSLRKIPNKFLRASKQSVWCSLAGIAPLTDTQAESMTWCTQATELFKEMVERSSILKATFKENQHQLRSILLYKCYSESENICINIELVNRGFAIQTKSYLTTVNFQKFKPNSKDDKICSEETEGVKFGDDEYDSRIYVRVLSYINPGCVIVALKELQPKFAKLNADLNDFYNNHSDIYMVTDIDKESMYAVLVKCENGKNWLRATFIKQLADDKYTMYLVDLGRTKAVIRSNIRKLDHMFAETMCAAIQCHVGGLIPAGGTDTWTGYATDQFRDELAKYDTICISKQGPAANSSYGVEFWARSIPEPGPLEPRIVYWISLNQFLVEGGLAFKEERESANQENQTNDVDFMNELQTLPKSINTLDLFADWLQKLPDQSYETSDEDEDFTDTVKSISQISPQKEEISVTELSKDSGNTVESISQISPQKKEISVTELVPVSKEVSVTNEQFKDSGSTVESISQISPQKKEISDTELVPVSEDVSTTNEQSKNSGSTVESISRISPQKKEISVTELVPVNGEVSVTNEESIDYASIYNNECAIIEQIEKNPLYKSANWKPSNKLPGSTFLCIPTHVDMNFQLYIQVPSLDNDKLKLITDVLQNWYNNTEPELSKTNWQIGQVCIALYVCDKMWYRGIVIEIDQKSKNLKVQFVDFGNVETVSFMNVREDVLFLNEPVLCYKCAVTKVKPLTSDKKWDLKLLDYIHPLIVEKPCRIQLRAFTYQNQTKYEVDELVILDGSNKSLYELLIEMNYAAYSDVDCDKERRNCFTDDDNDWDITVEKENLMGASPHSLATVKDGSSLQNPADVNDVYSGVFDYYKMTWELEMELAGMNTLSADHEVNIAELPLPIKVNTELVATVAHIEDEYVYLLVDESHGTMMRVLTKLFRAMMHDIQVYAPELPLLTECSIGSFCCCQYSVDDIWYRAVITDVTCTDKRTDLSTTDEMCKVQYIDYGNTEHVKKNRLRAMKEKWFTLPKVCLKAKLWNVQMNCNVADKLREILYEQLLKMLTTDPVTVKIKSCCDGSTPEVELYNQEDGKLAYQQYIKLQYFILKT